MNGGMRNVIAEMWGYSLKKAEDDGQLQEAAGGVRYTLKEVLIQRLNTYRYELTVWHGKGKKPIEHAMYSTGQAALKRVGELSGNAIARQARQQKFKAEDREREKEARAAIQVGTILSRSWGYDQTNVDFYEVTAKSASGATVTFRKIAARGEGPHPSGSMSDYVYPVPGDFVGEERTGRVGSSGVSLGNGDHARPTSPEKRHFCSWYG